jgi:hypothetical protein
MKKIEIPEEVAYMALGAVVGRLIFSNKEIRKQLKDRKKTKSVENTEGDGI